MTGLLRLTALFGGSGKRRKPSKEGTGTKAESGPDADLDADSDPSLFELPLPKERAWQERQRHEVSKAVERQRRQWQRYVSNRAERLETICKEYPSVRRYLRLLDKITPELEVTNGDDCNYDLAELATRCSVHSIEKDTDRSLVLQLTGEHLRKVLKKQGAAYTLNDPIPDFTAQDPPSPDTAMRELKRALNLH